MKKVFIKYNPYKLETELTVDGKGLAQNSQIGERIGPGNRIQEWIENLPDLLIREYNDTSFDVTFHGTLLDFEDVAEVFTHAYENGKLTATLDRIPAKETSDKEILIDEVFKEIRTGPFEELKDDEISNAFQHERSKEFEVCVVATMSAGKSTLINSMIGTKLMPSGQEACTAIITRIKDIEGTDAWQAKVYSKEGTQLKPHENLTYETMVRLNSDERVSLIKASGNIPFVSSEDAALVLIDTPGPNNSRDPEHKKVQSDFLNKSSKSLVLYIMEGTFGSSDDNKLLEDIAGSMAVDGKQSKDRFIFVVNKMDDRKKEDGDTAQTLERIRAYLKNHGITNPNLFPAAALPALNIRLIESGVELDEDDFDETEMKIRKLNRNENLHFETYSFLPPSMKGEIKKQLDDARQHNNANTEALIHTGIVSIEAAIRQYVHKYAKTAKIKNIVDTFMHKLDEVGCYEKTKQELAKNIKDGARIAAKISFIQKKVNDGKTAKAFKDAVDNAVVKVNDSAGDVIDFITQKFQAKITKKIDELQGRELAIDEVTDEIEQLERFSKKQEFDLQSELDELIRGTLLKSSNALLDEYKKKLASLTEEIGSSTLSGIEINPLKLMGGYVAAADKFSATQLVQSKEVKNGEEWVENTDRQWYKPWTWLQEKGYYRAKYKTVKYVAADALAQEFFLPFNRSIIDNADLARKYALKQSNHIAASFNIKFEHLDTILKQKLSELESYATDQENAAERIKETERRLSWLENIESRVASILEI